MLHTPSTGAQAVNAQLRAEVAALRVTVAAHGSTSECSSQTDALHGDMESGATADAKSERIAQLACAPRCPAMSRSPETRLVWPPELKYLMQQMHSRSSAFTCMFLPLCYVYKSRVFTMQGVTSKRGLLLGAHT